MRGWMTQGRQPPLAICQWQEKQQASDQVITTGIRKSGGAD